MRWPDCFEVTNMGIPYNRHRRPPMLLSTLLLAAAFLLPPAAGAASLQINLLDAEGDPLENAVVSIQGRILSEAVAGADSPAEALMDQREMKFTPHVLPVRRNTLVDFPNSDQVRHQVYSFSPAKRFDLPLYANQPQAPVHFETAGPVVLGCNIHDHMIGYIYVVDSHLFAVTGDDGQVRIDGLPENHREQGLELVIWHPAMGQDGEPLRKPLGELKPDAPVSLQIQLVFSPPPGPRSLQDGRSSSVRDRFRRHTHED